MVTGYEDLQKKKKKAFLKCPKMNFPYWKHFLNMENILRVEMKNT
jgi:hypothetical protein